MVGLVEALSFFPLSTKRKVACTGPALSQLDQLLPIEPTFKGPSAGIIYSRLFTYIQQQTTENSISPCTS